MGGDDIRRWAISVPERSSSSGNTQHWPRNPGVYEIGASPNWRGTSWDRQLVCESFGGHYGDGDCHYGGP